jgi:hypothetical protein
MSSANLQAMNVNELVERFATIAVEQDAAMMEGAYGNSAKYDRLFRQMRAVEQELKSRPGDQRTALLTLYQHPNMQARLMAAKLTLAVAPEAGRRMLQTIVDSHRQPQAGDAGMSLWNLDRGVFVPK